MGLSLLRRRREERNHSCGSIICQSSKKEASGTKTPVGMAEIIGSSGRRKMRIADVLREPHDAYDDSPCSATVKGSQRKCEKGHAFAEAPDSSSPCTGTPVWVLSRWLASVPKTGTSRGGRGEGGCLVGFLRGKGADIDLEDGKTETDQHTMAVEVEGLAGSPSSSSSVAAAPATENGVSSIRGDEEASVSEAKETPLSDTFSGRLSEKASFNLGLGAGLILLLARNSDEYKKTLELRREMDMILQEIKKTAQDQNPPSKPIESKADANFTVSDSCGNGNSSNCKLLQDHRLSFGFIEQEELPPDQHEGCPDYQEGNDGSVDHLEKEIQTELELLQLGLDEEEITEPCGHQTQGPSGYEAEMMDESHISESYTVGSEEVDHNLIEEDDTSCQNGVCPIQLERRLHELLHARQQERIDELEFALRSAETKLCEKEMEIAWWRDTVRLVSNRNPENPVM